MRVRALVAFALACTATVGQRTASDDLVDALDRWTFAYLAGGIDLTDDVASPPRLPARLVADPDLRLGEHIQFRQLVQAAVATGSRAVVDRLLRILDLRFPGRRWRWDHRIACVVVDAAFAAGPPEVFAHLLDVARDGSGSHRPQALRLLGATGPRAFAPVLAKLLDEQDDAVRAAAARTLGELGDPATVLPLAMSLRLEKTDDGIAASLDALARLLHVPGVPPQAHALALRAAAVAAVRAVDVELTMDAVRFLDTHRSDDAVPALIDVLARTAAMESVSLVRARQRRDLRHEAHRVLRAMTGAVLDADDLDGWRRLWETTGGMLDVPAAPRPDTRESTTVARPAGSFFDVPVRGRTVVFVLDASSSMRSTVLGTRAHRRARPWRMDIAVRELGVALAALGPDTAFTVVLFAHAPRVWRPEFAIADDENKAAALRFARAARPDGSTDLWQALEFALSMTAPGPDGARDPVDEVFLLSDGVSMGGRITDSGAIAAAVADLTHRTGTRVHCIAAWSEAGGTLLRRIAKHSGGAYVSFFVE